MYLYGYDCQISFFFVCSNEMFILNIGLMPFLMPRITVWAQIGSTDRL